MIASGMRIAPLVLGLVLPGCLEAPPDSPAGDVRQKTIILHPLSGDVEDVPIGIVLDADSDVMAAARPDGADIHFTDKAGRQLAHELEAFDPDSGGIAAWVRLDRVVNGHEIELRYGGEEASQDPLAVWDGYAAVWHMNSPVPVRDSTMSSIDGEVAGQDPEVVGGIAGPALAFDRTGEIDLGDPPGDLLDFGEFSFTYEVWVFVPEAQEEELSEFDKPWYKGGSSPSVPGYDLELGLGGWRVSLSDGEVTRGVSVSADRILDEWVHIAVVIDREASELRGYRDGVLRGTDPLGSFGSLSSGERAAIGGTLNNLSDFVGIIDEVRVRPGVLRDDVIEIQSASLGTPATFFEVGPEESPP